MPSTSDYFLVPEEWLAEATNVHCLNEYKTMMCVFRMLCLPDENDLLEIGCCTLEELLEFAEKSGIDRNIILKGLPKSIEHNHLTKIDGKYTLKFRQEGVSL